MGLLKEMMKKLEEEVKRKEIRLAWAITARNSLAIEGVTLLIRKYLDTMLASQGVSVWKI